MLITVAVITYTTHDRPALQDHFPHHYDTDITVSTPQSTFLTRLVVSCKALSRYFWVKGSPHICASVGVEGGLLSVGTGIDLIIKFTCQKSMVHRKGGSVGTMSDMCTASRHGSLL